MTISVVKEANASSAGNNEACSDGKNGEDKCSGSQRYRAGVRTECGDPS